MWIPRSDRCWRVGGRAEAWVWENLVGLECIVDVSQTVAADRLDLLWRSGAVFHGIGTANQAVNLYAQPSAEEPAVGQVDAGQLLVIETVVEDDQDQCLRLHRGHWPWPAMPIPS